MLRAGVARMAGQGRRGHAGGCRGLPGDGAFRSGKGAPTLKESGKKEARLDGKEGRWRRGVLSFHSAGRPVGKGRANRDAGSEKQKKERDEPGEMKGRKRGKSHNNRLSLFSFKI